MRLTLVTPPAVEPVTLEEVKDHLRVSHSDEDVRISGFIITARQQLDGRHGLLGRCLISQQWKLTMDAFPRELALPFPPVRSVDEIRYFDATGEERILDPATYVAAGLADELPAVIGLRRNTAWPATRALADDVSILFTCGYGDSPDDVPEPIRTAIMLHVEALYDGNTDAAGDVPLGYEDHIRPYRLWGF